MKFSIEKFDKIFQIAALPIMISLMITKKDKLRGYYGFIHIIYFLSRRAIDLGLKYPNIIILDAILLYYAFKFFNPDPNHSSIILGGTAFLKKSENFFSKYIQQQLFLMVLFNMIYIAPVSKIINYVNVNMFYTSVYYLTHINSAIKNMNKKTNIFIVFTQLIILYFGDNFLPEIRLVKYLSYLFTFIILQKVNIHLGTENTSTYNLFSLLGTVSHLNFVLNLISKVKIESISKDVIWCIMDLVFYYIVILHVLPNKIMFVTKAFFLGIPAAFSNEIKSIK